MKLEMIVGAVILAHLRNVLVLCAHHWRAAFPAPYEAGADFLSGDPVFGTYFIEELVELLDVLPQTSHHKIGAIASPFGTCRVPVWPVCE